MRSLLIAAVLGAFCGSLLLSANAAAQDRKQRDSAQEKRQQDSAEEKREPGNKIRLRPGVKATMTGKSSGAIKAADGVDGTFSCTCSSTQGGTCSVVQQDDALDCVKGSGDTCTAECRLKTRIRGAVRAKLMY